MAEWVLSCPDCFKLFAHSTISTEPVIYDPLWPDKPEFPAGGLKLKCPNCGKSNLFQRSQLLFRR
jgi:uncharacterized C2H2 Zn-finger protein